MRQYGLVREMSPTLDESATLLRHVGANRFAQNWAIENVKQGMADQCKWLCPPVVEGWSFYSLRRVWNVHKDRVAPWHGEVAERALRSGIKRAADGLDNWNKSRKGKRKGGAVGFPSIRKRGQRDSAHYDTCLVSEDGWAVQVPKIGWVALKEQVVLGEGMRGVELVVRPRAGRWFATVVVREDDWQAPESRVIRNVVGVDLGISDRMAVIHNGEVAEVVDNPRVFRAGEKKLALLQRRLARKKKGSNNRAKAKLKVAKQHYKIACRRQDYIHKLTTRLVKTQDLIAIEDLAVQGMSQALKLGKSVGDAANAEFRRQLEYKALWNGATVVVVSRWFPSSKTCSDCGARNHIGMERLWMCAICGVKHDRDITASLNLYNAGSSLVDACGALQPDVLKQEEMSVANAIIP